MLRTAFCHDFGLRPSILSQHLPITEFAINQRTHETHRTSPFKLMYGTDPMAIPLVTPQIDAPVAEDRLNDIQRLRSEANAAHELARNVMMNRTKGSLNRFEAGQKVWLDTRNLHINTAAPRKFWEHRTGPFLIEQKLGPVTYKLKLLKQWHIHPVFHANLLMPHVETAACGPQFNKPPPDIVAGQEEWEIEAITGHKGLGNCRHYLIKWKGYSNADSTWEPTRNITNVEELLNNYKKLHKL